MTSHLFDPDPIVTVKSPFYSPFEDINLDMGFSTFLSVYSLEIGVAMILQVDPPQCYKLQGP